RPPDDLAATHPHHGSPLSILDVGHPRANGSTADGESEKWRGGGLVAVDTHVRPEIDLHVAGERPERTGAELDVRARRIDVAEDAKFSRHGPRERRREHRRGLRRR